MLRPRRWERGDEVMAIAWTRSGVDNALSKKRRRRSVREGTDGGGWLTTQRLEKSVETSVLEEWAWWWRPSTRGGAG